MNIFTFLRDPVLRDSRDPGRVYPTTPSRNQTHVRRRQDKTPAETREKHGEKRNYSPDTHSMATIRRRVVSRRQSGRNIWPVTFSPNVFGYFPWLRRHSTGVCDATFSEVSSLVTVSYVATLSYFASVVSCAKYRANCIGNTEADWTQLRDIETLYPCSDSLGDGFGLMVP